MKKNVCGWPQNDWTRIGKQVVTEGHSHLCVATNEKLAHLFSRANKLFNIVARQAEGENVPREEFSALVDDIRKIA